MKSIPELATLKQSRHTLQPASLALPANRVTDTLLTRTQAYIPAQLQQRLWRKAIDAKCHNQLSLARELAPDDERMERFEMLARGRGASKEEIPEQIMLW